MTIVPDTSTEETLLWDRKRDGGFPGTFAPLFASLYFEGLGWKGLEVKQLKALVRNIVDPTRNLGHVDRALNKEKKEKEDVTTVEGKEPAKPESGAELQQVADATAAAQTSEQVNPPRKSQEVCEDCQ